MTHGAPMDGFRLAYARAGSGPHFVALQAPDEVAAAIRAATGTSA